MKFEDRFFVWRGRISQRSFLIHGLTAVVGSLCIALFGVWVTPVFAWLGLTLVLCGFGFLGWILVALIIKRLHDLSLPGFYASIILLPGVMSVLVPSAFGLTQVGLMVSAAGLLFLLVVPGQKGVNQYDRTPSRLAGEYTLRQAIGRLRALVGLPPASSGHL